MKTAWVAMRTIVLKDESRVSFPLGVFTDKEDAIKEADAGPRAIAGAHDAVKAAFGFVGIVSISGYVTDVPFKAGAGLLTPEAPSLILPGHAR